MTEKIINKSKQRIKDLKEDHDEEECGIMPSDEDFDKLIDFLVMFNIENGSITYHDGRAIAEIPRKAHIAVEGRFIRVYLFK